MKEGLIGKIVEAGLKFFQVVCDPVTKKCHSVLIEHWEIKYRRKFHRYAGWIFAIDIVLLGLIAAFIVGGLFSRSLLPQPLPTDFPRVEIIAPKSLVSGAAAEYAVSYANFGQRSVDCADLLVTLPVGFMLETDAISGGTAAPEERCDVLPADAVPVAADGATVKFRLGSLPPGTASAVRLRGVMYGASGAAQRISADLSYWPEAATRAEHVRSRRESPVTGTVLPLTLDFSEETLRGRVQRLTIEYANESGATLTGAAVRLEPPPNFRLTGAAPAVGPTLTWRLPPLAPGARGSVTVYGYLAAGRIGRGENFLARATLASGARELMLAEVRANADPRASNFVLEIEPVTSTALYPGEAATITLRYRNDGTESLRDLTVEVIGDDRVLVPDGPAATTVAELASGAAGTFSIVYRVKDEIDRLAFDEGQPLARLSGHASYNIGDDPRPIYDDTAELTLPVATELAVTAAAAYYTAEGDQLGRGPFPPRPGEETRYRVLLDVANTTTAVRGAMLTATLPTGASWTGRYAVTIGEAIDFLPSSRTVRWTIGEIPAGTGGPGGAVVAASIEVGVTPNEADTGAMLPLLTDIVVSGQDEFALVTVRGQTGPVQTDMVGTRDSL